MTERDGSTARRVQARRLASRSERSRTTAISRLFVACLLTIIVVACGGAEEREAKYLSRGKALYEQGDLVKARLEFQNALQINPKGAEGLYYLGLINEAQGEWQQAFANFGKAATEKPDHAQAQF
jgi:tetratricopeptide (TPR) repeat protein